MTRLLWPRLRRRVGSGHDGTAERLFFAFASWSRSSLVVAGRDARSRLSKPPASSISSSLPSVPFDMIAPGLFGDAASATRSSKLLKVCERQPWRRRGEYGGGDRGGSFLARGGSGVALAPRGDERRRAFFFSRCVVSFPSSPSAVGSAMPLRCDPGAAALTKRPNPETIRQVARVFKVFKLVKFMANATGGTSEFAEVLEETLFTSAMADYLKVHE